ncbi:hypothetical protein SKAU_G00411460 [Synaphobranchus kaupii]|uniref:Reverse transcriptase RNase H-like domain-containing protein n=1 Tax=Synaphobranchus kaupii TaxID=118154 RepID=A0A9Q1IBQ5_SYNKA|nr:hypothetical protein SKAU_G00411460 [Synaphobranchus kaupii]
MSPAKRLVAEEKVKEMAAAGVIEPSDSPWAAPAVLVQKSGEWRFCVDYRRLNSATTKDSYPLPRIDEALDHISGSSWFSSLDLRSGYWQEGQSMAFDQLRAALTEAPVLAYPDAQRPFIVDTDASNIGVGAVLSQEDEDGERVAYYSRALGKVERNYCVTRRELLAVVRALHHYLQGSHFLLRTDHASLTWLLNFKDPEGQVARWLEQLQGYDFKIRHRAGRLHGAAQECRYCSRQEERDQVSPDVAVVQASGDAEGWLPLTPMELREAQEADSTLGKVRAGWRRGSVPSGWWCRQRAQSLRAITACTAAWCSATVSSTDGGRLQAGAATSCSCRRHGRSALMSSGWSTARWGRATSAITKPCTG